MAPKKPGDTILGDPITAAQYADEKHIHPSTISRWVSRGYLNADGERVYLKPRWKMWINGRLQDVYHRADLAAAELATRPKGGRLRQDPVLRGAQKVDKDRRKAARQAA